MNTAQTKKTSGQYQTAPVKPSNKLFLLLTLFVLAATNVWAALPTVAPAAPTSPAGSVIALWNSSGTYVNITGVNFYESWGGWGATGDYTIPSTTSVLKSYKAVNYGGIGFEGNLQNISSKTHLHIDLWTPNGSSFAIRLVSTVGGTADYTYTTAGGQITPNTWLHLDMPISAFHTANPGMDLTKIQQIGLIDNNAGETPGADYYIDNLYFYNAAAAPATPTGLTVTATGANSVSLSWAASTGSPTTYNVKRSTTSGGTYTTIGTTTAPTTNYTDTVAGGSTYYYEVSAVNVGGESANSSYVSASPTLGAPSAPTGLTANVSDGQVSLSWSASIAATGYNVKRSTSSGAEVTIASAGTTSYTDSTVANGTTYFYEVSATNSAGQSANSSEVSASPVAFVNAYESFNYSLGSFADGTANTGTGLTGNWTVGNGTIVSGLTYTGLSSGHNAISTTGSRNQVSLSSPLSTGTKYVSFLFNQLGNNGGNLNGLVLYGSGATSLIVGITAPYSGSAGSLGLGSIATAGGVTGITTFSGQQLSGGFNYNQTHLIVLRIDFNTSGANDTVSLWLDPAAGTNAPAGAANLVWSAYDVGTITGIGFNIQGGGNADVFDEIRTGSSYGSVVGAPVGAAPTTLALSVGSGKEISWSAVSTNYYQVQSSPDNSTWSNVGSELTGSAVTSVYDPASAAYYQVLQDTPVITEEVQQGDFESDPSYSWSLLGTMPPTWINTDFHNGASCESFYVTNASTTAQTSILEENVYNKGGAAIIPGNTYTFSFWAKSLPKNGGYVQRYNPVWMDGSGNVLGTLAPIAWPDITASTSTWTQISLAPAVAPAGAVTVLVQYLAANGGTVGDFGGMLLDDVSLTTTSPANSPSVIASTVQSGAVFTATVQTNGVTAIAATGTVAFKTNSVAQSVGTVATGTANSTPTAVPAAYTITAIYSGDSVYASSTNTLVVGTLVNTSRTNLVMSVLGNQLTLSWPADHTGWTLQSQTNSLSTGLSATWSDVSGSTTTNQMIMTINPANPAVFYRIKY